MDRQYLIVSCQGGRLAFKSLAQWCHWHDLDLASAHVVLDSRFPEAAGPVFVAEQDTFLKSLPPRGRVQPTALEPTAEQLFGPVDMSLVPPFHEAKEAGLLTPPPRPPAPKPTLAPRAAPAEKPERDSTGRFLRKKAAEVSS